MPSILGPYFLTMNIYPCIKYVDIIIKQFRVEKNDLPREMFNNVIIQVVFNLRKLH